MKTCCIFDDCKSTGRVDFVQYDNKEITKNYLMLSYVEHLFIVINNRMMKMLIINDNVDHLLYDARLRLHPLQLPRENMIWRAACKDIIDNQCKDHINHR